ncbi:hypothetical protein JL857_24250 [Vibrio parahaemolyticus]|nr:hypothetical protein [Vibrio parahaemolyticus]MCC4219215.1 hypothetical protein [Vibrio parahaemolyticus]MCI9697145.1 hypothetical protein [Vibrio parahaemolyticus]MCI9711751.1 hypothetical protein [Vibrio parahaemolyticus]MCI9716618.1 hypothetical protein [Vibrio parahaemolyticus]MCR9722987.1 hypothetical protein [Vibrio parahaemolyticus]
MELKKIYKKSIFIGFIWSLIMILILLLSVRNSSQVFYSFIQLIIWPILFILVAFFHELGHASASLDCKIDYNAICLGRREKEKNAISKSLCKWLLPNTKVELWMPYFPFNVDYEDSAFENIIAKDFLLILRSGALVGLVMCLSSLITITLFLLGAWLFKSVEYNWLFIKDNAVSSIYVVITGAIFQLINFIPISNKGKPLSDGAIIKRVKEQLKSSGANIDDQRIDTGFLKQRT